MRRRSVNQYPRPLHVRGTNELSTDLWIKGYISKEKSKLGVVVGNSGLYDKSSGNQKQKPHLKN